MKRLFIKLMLLLTVGGVNPVLAVITSGWETESSLVKLKSGDFWPDYYALPYLAYNLRNDGRWVLISGQEAYGGYFGYYWDNGQLQWVKDASLVKGLTAHGWYEAPAFAANVTGDGKWTLIGHAGNSFYGYYWDGTQWVEDSSRVNGLNATGRTSHVFLENFGGDGNWTLITGTEDGTFKAFYWDGSQWIEDSTRVNGLSDIGQNTRVGAGFNIFGDNQWNLIAASYDSRQFRIYNWDGSKWIEDSAKLAGLDTGGMHQLAPTVGYNLRGDNKWALLSGMADQRRLWGYFSNTADTSNLPGFINVTHSPPLATMVKLNFSYPDSWNYRIKYSLSADMGNALFSDWIKDTSNVNDYNLPYLQPNTFYYYQIYAYLPWDTNYYAVSVIDTFTTQPSQAYLLVPPGQSIQEAIYTLPLEGGTVELGEGTHRLNSPVRILSNNITFQGQGIDKTVIEGGGIYLSKYNDGPAQVAYNYANSIKEKTFHDYSNANPGDFVQNVVISSLTIHNPIAEGINVVQGWNIKIDTVKIYRDSISSNSGVYMGYTRDSVVQNSQISNFSRGIFYWGPEKNDIIGNVITDTYEALEYNGSWTFTTPVIVKGNKIKKTVGDALYLYSVVPQAGGSMLVSDNVVELASSWKRAGIAMVLANDIVVEKNIIKDGYGPGIWVKSKNNYTPPRLNVGKHIIRNNLIYNNSENGILFTDEYAIPLSIQSFVYSNTIYGNGSDGLENSQGHNITLKNNIIMGNKRYGINGPNTSTSYNDVWNNVSGNYNNISAGTGDISADPLFADPVAGNFHLQSQYGRWNGSSWVYDAVTSPGINAGDPADDYSNEPQPNGGRINIGMYGNTVEASKSSIDPPPPPLVDLPKENKIKIYPNPYIKGKGAGSKITFINLPKDATIKIYKSSGELVRDLSAGSNDKAEWDVSDISSGIYLYVVTSPEGVKKGKVSVIK